ncbi:MAG: Vi polysaccharide biosynthesis UDP-N-acetylglucosamine C-6 dehydrogenase TviB [Gammaproteobacteria bacterium]|nr:Vi polysaccharide biosynthesis UDP-N-acetylglucosamine C-6 dehydrogenase TviB [Gammaproteobacteria bacterium]
MMKLEEVKLAIVGLGYVGLPLAVEFGKKRPVVGFDINQKRVEELQSGKDSTLEVEPEELLSANGLHFVGSANELAGCNCYIVTVPTPIDSAKKPDLRPLISASTMLGGFLKKGDVVIYESTVYPGATEEECVPVLEGTSGLTFNVDFYVGYSPERINPGDKAHRLPAIKKVTSGSVPEIASLVDDLYQEIISAGTYKASSIKVAEAAKVIENTQRDLNIALINELAIIFSKLEINTNEVLDAAGTKWNFLPFRPGLVGGHCIGVDPYYLTHKAESVGYQPDVILAGRRINDGMGKYVATETIKAMLKAGVTPVDETILVMGITFKENCPDLRNTKVTDVIDEMQQFGANVEVYDPWVSKESLSQLGVPVVNSLSSGKYGAIVIAVAHSQFKELPSAKVRALCKPNGIVYDLKNVLPAGEADMSL